MTIQELVQLIMEHAEEYATHSIEKIPVGVKQKKTNKKKRINKKWRKYGLETVYEFKQCKKIEVTYELIADFCSKYGYPLPDRMFDIMPNGDSDND